MIATDILPRRRMIPLASRAGAGDMAVQEFGPAGRALDVLFLHANGFNAFTYRQILAPLGADLRVMAVDMRGHGHSRLPTIVEGHSWRVYADDVLALLAALGEVPRVLAGHSMGGATALLAAPALRGGPPVELVLFDPVLAPPERYSAVPDWEQPIARGALRRKGHFASGALAFIAYRGRGAFATWPDAVLQDYLADGLVAAPEGGVTLACAPGWEAANFASACIVSPYDGLEGTGGGVRVLKAERESVCFISGQEPAFGASDRGRLEVVPGTTHFLPMERPDLVRAALREVAGQAA
jgi:pimeloyl-ACP methyl ester carboxylesterase